VVARRPSGGRLCPFGNVPVQIDATRRARPPARRTESTSASSSSAARALTAGDEQGVDRSAHAAHGAVRAS
jgi:hypothetical protein